LKKKKKKEAIFDEISFLFPVMSRYTYQCTGNVEVDFPALCALLNIKEILAVRTKHPHSTTDKNEGGPCLNIELENEDPLSAKRMWISGKNKQLLLSGCYLLFLSCPLCCRFWQAGLTDPMVISLTNTTSLCSNLREVSLEGNPLPNLSFHHLLSEDSKFTQVSLRNNRIGDEGARLIGSALSTIKSANKNLLWLNLAFNNIGDEGAAHIAKGLRLNRTLLFISLCKNQIGDLGAAHLAEIIGEFSLTHEEVERRKLLFQRIQAVSNIFGTNRLCLYKQAETMETGTPLLDPSVYHKDGKLFLPGNTTLESLNLSGLCTCSKISHINNGNLFPTDSQCYTQIKEMVALKNPLAKSGSTV
uniref:Leucine rich repeat containing 71 n=1 Tax=Cyprinodon variegatus TaxID=28743 RepID=A0A3Q2G0Q1_CYPVA